MEKNIEQKCAETIATFDDTGSDMWDLTINLMEEVSIEPMETSEPHLVFHESAWKQTMVNEPTVFLQVQTNSKSTAKTNG